MVDAIPPPESYPDLLAALKARIHGARLRAAVSVNRELILLYWEIGHDLLLRQSAEGCGTGVIDRLAGDLRWDFPDMTGLSPRNLKYMRAFAEARPDRAIVQQLVAQLPWGHNLRLLETLKLPEERAWYAQQAVEHGWSRPVLVHQIDVRLIERAGKARTNFARTLPSPQSDLARANCSRTPTISMFPRGGGRYSYRAGTRTGACWTISARFSLSSARASPLSAGSITSRSAIRTSIWTCSSTTCVYAASS